ncbi:hypothetical protein MAJ_03173, partial [Metarhizium majus ARSEF 297]
MTSQDHGSLLNNQEDILAGLENNPASATYHAEDCFGYYTQHNVSQSQLSSDYTLSLPQHDRIRARLAQTQRLTDNLTQVFVNDANTIPYQHHGTQSAPSTIQPSHFQQFYDENNISLPLQAAQDGPAVGESVIGNVEAPFDANLWQHNPTFGVSSNNEHESSNSHLNVLAAPFYPPSHAANWPTDSTEQNKTPEVTDGPLRNIERDAEYHPPSGDCSWLRASDLHYNNDNNNDGSIDEIITLSSYNNPLALSGLTSTSLYTQPYGDELATMPGSQQAFNAPYTQYIDNGVAFTGGMLYSPQPTTAPSQVSTSISGAGSQHEYSSSSLTAASSLRQTRSIPSRTAGWGPRRAPSLSRSISAQTSFSHESNGSGPSRRGNQDSAVRLCGL